MTNPSEETAVEEQSQPQQASHPGGGRMPVPCECNIVYKDKVNETIVTVDQPIAVPGNMLQFHCGDEMILINQSDVRRCRIKVIRTEQSRIVV